MATDFPGMDPEVPSGLVSPQVMDQIRSILSTEQMQALSSERTVMQLEKMVEGMLTELVTAGLEQASRSPGGQDRIRQLADQMADRMTGSTSAPTASRVSSAAAAADVAAHSPTPEAPTYPEAAPSPDAGGSPRSHRGTPGGARGTFAPRHRDEEVYTPFSDIKATYQEARSAPVKTTMGGIRSAASRFVQTQTDRATGDWIPERDEAGNPTGGWILPGDPMNFDPRDPNAEIRDYVAPDDPRGAGIARKARTASFVGSNVQSMLAGRGLAGSLGGAAARVAGPIGVAVGAVSMVGGALEKQHQQAEFYRSAFGEDGTGMFAARDRFSEWVNGLQGFGSIGGERAREQFRQASALGLRGSQREDAMDFSGDMWKTLGIDTGESMEMVKASVDEGNLSLTEYAETLKEVSRAAVESGRSSREAVADFNAARKQISEGVTRGDASLDIATDLSQMTDRMNKQTLTAFGGAQGLSGVLTNQQAVMYGASLSGQNPLEAAYNLEAGGERSTEQARQTLAATSGSIVQRMAAFFRISDGEMRRTAKEAAVGGVVPTDEQERIWREVWSGGSTETAFLADQQLAANLRSMGFQTGNAGDNRTMFFSMLLGDLDQTESGDGKAKSLSVKGHKAKKGSEGLFGDDAKTGEFLRYKRGDEDANRRALTAVAGSSLNWGGAEEAYVDEVLNKYGRGNKAIEELLKSSTSKKIEDFTGESAGDVKYLVKDREGKRKELSLEEVIKSKHYRQQLNTGAAKIKGEGNEVESVSKFTGITSDGSDDSGSRERSDSKTFIEFTGEARRFFRVAGPTDAERKGLPSGGELNPSMIPDYTGR